MYTHTHRTTAASGWIGGAKPSQIAASAASTPAAYDAIAKLEGDERPMQLQHHGLDFRVLLVPHHLGDEHGMGLGIGWSVHAGGIVKIDSLLPGSPAALSLKI